MLAGLGKKKKKWILYLADVCVLQQVKIISFLFL